MENTQSLESIPTIQSQGHRLTAPSPLAFRTDTEIGYPTEL